MLIQVNIMITLLWIEADMLKIRNNLIWLSKLYPIFSISMS